MRVTLRAARVNAGLSQEAAGKLIGVSADKISNWERHITFPDVSELPKIEKPYGVTYDDIIFLPENFGLTESEEELPSVEETP